MQHRHEAFTLLRHCSSICKVTHLLRTIPPHQLRKFLYGFDEALRKAFEKLIDQKLSERWWRIVRLPPKYGGFGLRSGVKVAGAQHLMSLIKCSPEMKYHTNGWNLNSVAKLSTENWLKNLLGAETNINSLINGFLD